MYRRLVGYIAAGTLVLMSVLLPTPVFGLAVPPAPSLERPIVDQTQTLSSAQIDDLAAQIATSRSQKDYQIGVLIIPTLGQDEYLEGYAIKVARGWGIGEKEKDNGVLLLVVKDDRKLRIEVGRGLEGDIPDIIAGRIIRDTIAPEFKKQNYYAGISKGIESIQAAVEGRPDPNRAAAPQFSGSFFDLITMASFAVFWFVPWLGAIMARSRSWWLGGIVGGAMGAVVAALMSWSVIGWLLLFALTASGVLLDYFVSRDYYRHKARGEEPSWWAGGTTFGGRGGGGGSFGGGGFSGGGASGGW